MARPRKAPQERRTRQINIRVTLAEFVTAKAHATALGITAAELAWHRLCSYSLPRPVAFVTALLQAVGGLAAIGNNLNQLARHANAGRMPHADRLREVLDGIAGLTARIHALLDGLDDPRGHETRPEL